MNPGSAPVPLKPVSRERAEQPTDGVRLTRRNRQELEQKLWNDPAGRTVPVWLYDETEECKDAILLTDQYRWRRFAESELYTLFHYKMSVPTDGRSERKWWADYCRLNQKSADRILEIYKPGDIVWVHDYHLMLLPSLLRQRIPNIYVGFFLHTPFPTSELFRCLPPRKQLLTGPLGANMVGFQSYNYARHFASCASRVCGFEALESGIDAYGAHIAVNFFPVGIDAKLVEREAFDGDGIDQIAKTLREKYADMKIIVGRDRLDTVRGVSQKLMAYETFLQKHPEWRGKVMLIQITNPISIDEGKEDVENKIDKKVSGLVAHINGLYGGIDYTPVLHFPQHLSRQEYFALLRIADLGLVTSVRDGMNTTALEFVISQKENHSPLILSEFSGTATKLTTKNGATHVNPWDLSGVAHEIHEALVRSPEEKASQHEKLYQCVTTETVQAWSQAYLDNLLINLNTFNKSIATPLLNKVDLLLQYRKAKQRLFLFDYDGTLTPIVKDPAAAVPSDRVLRTIKKLSQDPLNSVWIISGRDQNFLSEWWGHIPELGLSAEHGSFIRHPQSDSWENLTEKFDMSWQEEVVQIFQNYTDRTQGSFIERKKIAVTWHYRRTDPEFGAYQARECRKALETSVAKKYDVEVMSGKANLEVRPRFVNKGEIAKRLVESYRDGKDASTPVSQTGPNFVLCLGDDFTDEDMFRSLMNSDLPRETVFTCTVGASSKKTLAYWHLLEPSDVIATIAFLNGRPSATDAAAVEAVEARLNGEGTA